MFQSAHRYALLQVNNYRLLVTQLRRSQHPIGLKARIRRDDDLINLDAVLQIVQRKLELPVLRCQPA